MRQAVTHRPGTADQPANAPLAAEALESRGVIGNEAAVVPADGATHLVVVGVDPAGGVMGRRDAAGDPVVQALAAAESGRDGTDAGPRLAFELKQVQFRNAALRPEIGRQAD